MGMREALRMALDVDLLLEGEGTGLRREFTERGRRDGLKAALRWREETFGNRYRLDDDPESDEESG